MNVLSPKAVAEQWLDRLWNQGDVSVIDELADPEMQVVMTRDTSMKSGEDFRQFYQQITSSFQDLTVTPVDIIESGEKVAGVCRVQARRRSDGKEVDYDFGFIGKVQNGRWVEAYNVVDFLEMLKCLDEVDSNAMEKAML